MLPMPETMASVSLHEPISPELALVCPELRERALALLPDPALTSPRRRPAPPAERLPPLPVAVAVYVAGRAAATAVEAAALALLVLLLVLVASGLT